MDAFEDLDVWKRSSLLCVDIIQSVAGDRQSTFNENLTAAALEIAANIAEGYECGTTDGYISRLQQARSANGQLRTYLFIGIEAGILDRARGNRMIREAQKITRLLTQLMTQIQQTRPSGQATLNA